MDNLIIELATQSSRLRVSDKIGCRPAHDDKEAWWSRKHPYVILNDYILYGMESAAKAHRNKGIDWRQSALWPLLEHHSRYIETYNDGLIVNFDDLEFEQLYKCLSLRNTISYKKWLIEVGEFEEVTDDYGQPAYHAKIILSHAEKSTMFFSGVTASAKKIFEIMSND